MPDITCCPGNECPKKGTCYRFTAEPSKYLQSYFITPPYKQDGTCEYYWQDKKMEIASV